MTHNDDNLFKTLMQGVTPLKSSNKVVHEKPKPQPVPIQQPDYITREIIPSYPEKIMTRGKDVLFFSQPGVQSRVLKQLKQGKLLCEANLDLHGMTVEQAGQAVHRFIREACEQDCRVVRIVHGKGKPGEAAKLKSHVFHWLSEHPSVLGCVSAPPDEGGTGALNILLKKSWLDLEE